VAWLGSPAAGRRAFSAPLRLVRVRVPEVVLPARVRKLALSKNYRHRPEELWLVSDRLDLPAETISLLYQHRWQIEVFFRWLKHALGLKHLVFESPEGVSIQIYCALIASLLISLWTGRKPTKRTLEMIQLYFQGWAREEELEAHISRLAPIAQ
jgi:IS4 transposase